MNIITGKELFARVSWRPRNRNESECPNLIQNNRGNHGRILLHSSRRSQ